MNAKKCKALRQYIRQGALPWKNSTTYQEIKRRPKTVPTGKLNPDGTQQFTVITPVTVVLDDCDRRAYQHAKKAMRK